MVTDGSPIYRGASLWVLLVTLEGHLVFFIYLILDVHKKNGHLLVKLVVLTCSHSSLYIVQLFGLFFFFLLASQT